VDIPAADLAQWTKDRIDRVCRADYRRYERALREHYTRYFQRHPQLRCPRHPYSARTLASALPPGCSDLQKLIRRDLLHRFARSARSSQMLALSLLGNAAQNDDSLSWFWSALNLPFDFSNHPVMRFEHCLAPSDLNEVPRTTKLDLSVSTRETFIAVETKWSEPGFGVCSCVKDGDGNPRAGFDCAARVRSRTAYWKVAQKFFGLEPVRLPLLPCSLSPFYQVVRNVAAAINLSRDRRAGFVLIYDETNPYFRQIGRCGWPTMLTRLLKRFEHSGLCFRAVSWQRLIEQLPISESVREWAREKHRL
jgi:hypothetical protein